MSDAESEDCGVTHEGVLLPGVAGCGEGFEFFFQICGSSIMDAPLPLWSMHILFEVHVSPSHGVS